MRGGRKRHVHQTGWTRSSLSYSHVRLCPECIPPTLRSKCLQAGRTVGQLTVRKIDDEIVRRLKIRAAERGRSAEAEHREILKQALLPEKKKNVDEWLRLARELRERIGPIKTDSTDIIREMRDRR
jgi:antitoxin FitA